MSERTGQVVFVPQSEAFTPCACGIILVWADGLSEQTCDCGLQLVKLEKTHEATVKRCPMWLGILYAEMGENLTWRCDDCGRTVVGVDWSRGRSRTAMGIVERHQAADGRVVEIYGALSDG